MHLKDLERQEQTPDRLRPVIVATWEAELRRIMA
jgi:hypothetical protein